MVRFPRLLHPRQALQRAAQLFAACGHHSASRAGTPTCTWTLFFEAVFAMRINHPARPPP